MDKKLHWFNLAFIDSEGFTYCKGCWKYKDVVAGLCYDCAVVKDDQLLKRNFFQHLYYCFKHLFKLQFDLARCDFNLFLESITDTGDYDGGAKKDRLDRNKQANK